MDDLTDRQRDLILRGLFELSITYTDDEALRTEAKAIASQLGGDPSAMFFGGLAHPER